MKALDSLTGMILGWVTGVLVYCAPALIGRNVHDLSAMMWWPAIIAFIAWFVFVLPTVYLVPIKKAAGVRLPLTALVGGLYGVLMYALLVCTWARELWKLAWYPAVIVAVAATVFVLLERARQNAQRRRLANVVVAAVLIPTALFVVSLFWLVGVEHTATYQAKWTILDPATSPLAREGEPCVMIQAIDRPELGMVYYSRKIHDYLRSLPSDRVGVVIQTTSDFGRVRGFHFERIGDIPCTFEVDGFSAGGGNRDSGPAASQPVSPAATSPINSLP